MIIRLALLLVALVGQAMSLECGESWLRYQDTCVLLVSYPFTFQTSREYCQKAHADLIVLESQEMNDWLTSQISIYNGEQFWIGLSDRLVDGQFIWVDDSELTFTNWQPGEPNNGEIPPVVGEDCVEVYSNGRWNDEQCADPHDFICARSIDYVPKCDIATGWEEFNGKCYRWIWDNKKLGEATDYCNLMDGQVISINSEDEQVFANGVQSTRGNLQYWTGLSDQVSLGNFIWQDGTDTSGFSNWGDDEPNSDEFSPGCAMIKSFKSGDWSLDDCDNTKRFICERDEGTCADGWVLHGGQCYQFNALLRTWWDAKYYCESEGGWITSLLDGNENLFVTGYLDRLKDENVEAAWIGLSDTEADGTFKWVHTTGIIGDDYENWPPGKPVNTYGVEDCAYLDTADVAGTFYQQSCSLLAGFICKIAAGTLVTPVLPDTPLGSCDRQWALYGDSCYYAPDGKFTMTDAETECNALSANLLSIHSGQEQSFITERLRYYKDTMWIGLSDTVSEGNFVYTDGSGYDYMNWAVGEPNNLDDEHCVHMYSETYRIGLWNDNECHEPKRFICKKPKYLTPPVTVAIPDFTLPPSDRCGNSWVYDSALGSCYKIETIWTGWSQANDQCHVEGGFLTSITNPYESGVITLYSDYYRIVAGVWAFWIGLHDTNQERGFEWSDGYPVSYLNWNGGEPNDVGTGEDCVELRAGDGTWNDLNCDYANPYICKRNALITYSFTSYTRARLEATGDIPIDNIWPDECALFCLGAGDACRSFNYYRQTRSCTLLSIDKDMGTATLVAEEVDPWDHYQRDFTVPTFAPLTTLAPNFGCNKGEYGYRSYCYTLVDSVDDFNGMVDICELRSADLVSIADPSEMNFVTSLMQTGNTADKTISDIWLGLVDSDHEGWYSWTDGSTVTYTKWAAGEPNNNANDDDCVIHDYGLNGWVDVPCSGVSAYGVCKKPKGTSNVVAPSNEGCQPGWVKYMSSCYLMVSEVKLTWIDARDDCVARGGRLTTINSKYEQAYLASQMGAMYAYLYTGDYFIGLSDTDIPGTYLWVDGTYPVLSAWGPGQPDDSRYGQCVALLGGLEPHVAGLWISENCYLAHNYICERPIAGATDTPYTLPPVTRPSNIGCKLGSVGYGDFCFKMYETETAADQLSWSDARAECQKLGAELASFHSKDEEDYIVEKMTPNNTANDYGFWFGINDETIEAGWVWSDGTAVVYLNWGVNEPNDESGEDCAEIFLNEGRGWNDIPCYATRNWLCKTPKQVNEEPTLPPIGICPSDSDWKYVPPYCYYISDIVGNDDRYTWLDAEEYCKERGAHLVSIADDTENAILIEMAPLIASAYWIGLRQEVFNGQYTWADGTPYVYQNWDKGEPNNAHGEEACVELYRFDGLTGGGQWNDNSCGIKTPFICKKPYDSISPITSAPTETPVGGCNSPYFKYFNRCYRMGGYEESDRYEWKDARDVCISEGGNLAGIHGKEVQSLLTSMLTGVSTDVWIGFSDLGSNGQYHWTDGKSTVYTNWYPGEPSGIIDLPSEPNKNCVELLNEQWYAGTWNDVQCGELIAYICEKDLDPALDDNPPASTFCDDTSYYKYGDSCFKVDTTPRSFAAAQQFCESEGGNLASITDTYYEAYVEYLLFTSGASDAWIGMSSNEDGQYTWSDGWPVHFSRWGDSEPSQKDGEGCVILNDVPSWDDTSCTGTHAAICRSTNAVPPPPDEDTDGYCFAGTDAYGSFCYYLPPGLVIAEWYSANYACQSLGGNLASIHSKSENEFVRNLVATRLGIRTVWLGTTRSSTGGFENTDGTPDDYVHWANGEPTEEWRGTDEDCVEMYTNDFGTWNDADCFTAASYVCKFDKYRNETVTEKETGSLSGGAIAGIVISCVVIVTAALLVAGWFWGARTTSKPTTTTRDPFPTPNPPAGFDNALYVSNSNETKVQVDDNPSSKA